MEDLESVVLNSNHWELDNLADFIVTNHHQYVRKSVLAIEEQCKLLQDQYSRFPHLEQVVRVFEKAAVDLCENMNEEEQILFPYIRFQVHIKKGNIARSFLPPDSIKARIENIEREHTVVKEGIEEIRKLTNSYQVFPEGSEAYSLLIQMLKAFDADLIQHFRLETNLLFLKSIQLEKDYLENPSEPVVANSKSISQVTSILL